MNDAANDTQATAADAAASAEATAPAAVAVVAAAVAAAGRALLGWFVFYVLFAQALVIWKWQTPTMVTNDVIRNPISTPETNQQPPLAVIVLEEQLEQLEEVSKQLQKAIADATRQAVDFNRTLQQWQVQLDEANKAAATAEATTTKYTVQKEREKSVSSTVTNTVPNLQDVLLRSNLLQASSASSSSAESLPLAELFDLASVELDAVIGQRQWDVMARYIFNNDSNRAKATSTGTVTSTVFPRRTAIPAVGVAIANAAASCPKVVDEASVQKAQQAVIRMFGSQERVNETTSTTNSPNSSTDNRHAPGLPLSFTETVSSLRRSLEKAAANATRHLTMHIRQMQAATEATATRAESSTSTLTEEEQNCLWNNEDDQVLEWLNAGLEALEDGRDLRTALIQAVAAHDIDTTGLILDADFATVDDHQTSSATKQSSSASASSTATSINLRHVLDTPTLHESSILVDWLLQWINGRHDGLDDVLDKYVYAHVPEKDRIGPVAVEALLQWAGRVQIPLRLR